MDGIANKNDMVKKLDVEKALLADKGPNAALLSFEVKDFTKIGDQHASYITGVGVQYKTDDKLETANYVVKLNHNPPGLWRQVLNLIFDTEITFFSEILPLLNENLAAVNELPLRAPRCLHFVRTIDQQALYFDDLRPVGFKLHPRQNTMDKAHINLILTELARLHSASVLLMKSDKNFFNKYSKLDANYKSLMTSHLKDSSLGFFSKGLEGVAKTIDQVPNYEYVAEFLKKKVTTVNDEIFELMQTKEPFLTLSHGDCWNSNMMFR